jgi:hypothetical protein
MQSSKAGYDYQALMTFVCDWASWYVHQSTKADASIGYSAPGISALVISSNQWMTASEIHDQEIWKWHNEVDAAIARLPYLHMSALRVWAHLRHANKRHRVFKSNRMSQADIDRYFDEAMPLLVPLLRQEGVPI